MTNPNHTDTSRSGDLVERLRDLAAKFEGQGGRHYTAALFGECADRIEALEASVTGLTHQRDFLRESVDLSDQRIAELKRTAELLNGNMQHNHDEWLAAKDRIEALEAENERLRERLEIDPSHPYDGIYARDETIRGLDAKVERLRGLLVEVLNDDEALMDVTWITRARAALGEKQ